MTTPSQRLPTVSVHRASRQVAAGTVTSLALLALFLWLATAVAWGPPREADLDVEAVVARWRSGLLDGPMIVATYLCSWQVVIVGLALVVAYLAMTRRWLAAAAVLVSVVGDEAIVFTLKVFFNRARPDQTLALLSNSGASFPSGHTFIALAFYGLLACLAITAVSTRVARLAIAGLASFGILAVGVSRVYVGAHWPSDVLASLLLGGAWITVVMTTYIVLSTKHHPMRYH